MILNAIEPPAEAATAHSLMVTFPADETKADHTAPTPGVLTGEAVAVMAVVAPVTAVVFCTQVAAVVAVVKAALVAFKLKAKFTLVRGSGMEIVRAAAVAAG